MKSHKPEVSIIIPVLNEEDYIENCIESIVGSVKSFDFEILVIDGGSNDETLNILDRLTLKYLNLKIIHNPKKITPAALNLGIKDSLGEFIVRLDAHAVYHDKYIENSVNILKKSSKEIANVGGSIITRSNSESIFASSISLCLSSKFGVGDSKFRTEIPETSEFVGTVPFGCFRREIFYEIGLFNENEPRNEDLEFNRRIIKSGKKILLDPSIRSTYFSRTTLGSLYSQQFDNGMIVTDKFRGKESFHKLRHFIPLLFVF